MCDTDRGDDPSALRPLSSQELEDWLRPLPRRSSGPREVTQVAGRPCPPPSLRAAAEQAGGGQEAEAREAEGREAEGREAEAREAEGREAEGREAAA